MAHNRKFVPGVVFILKGKLSHLHTTISIQDDIENIMIESNFLENAPFKWIGLMYRLGARNVLKPSYSRINQKYGDLPIAVELNLDVLKWANDNDLKLLKDIFMIAGLEALLHVGNKYILPTEYVLAERAKYGNVPDTVEELEKGDKRIGITIAQ